MKRRIRWLQTVKVYIGPQSTSEVPGHPSVVQGALYKTFEKAEETWVHVHGSNPVRLSISGIGFLPGNITEGKHFEFIDDTNYTLMNIDDDLSGIDRSIQKLQRRAEPPPYIQQQTTEELVLALLARFREIHRRFATAVDVYSSGVAAILADVECTVGCTTDIDYREWLEARSDIHWFLQDARTTLEPFVEAMREDLTFEVRRQIERIFLHLTGKHEVTMWFEHLLYSEGFYPEDEESNDEGPGR
jgi:hypothetical protein